MSRTAISSILAVGLVTLAACGGQSSDEDQIRSTFEKATSSLKDGNGKGFCEALTPEAAASVANGAKGLGGLDGCSEVVGNVVNATKALSSGDWKTFCAAIGPEASKKIADAGKGSCAENAAKLNETAAGKQAFAMIAKQLEDSLSKVADGKVAKIEINGNKATATIANQGKDSNPVSFEKVDGKWRITANAASGSGSGSGQG